jgi:hypothetical protein
MASVLDRCGAPPIRRPVSYGQVCAFVLRLPGSAPQWSVEATQFTGAVWYDWTSPDLPPLQLSIIDRVLGADGLVFVIDSQTERIAADLECITSLRQLMTSRGHDLDERPLVFQANKRDLPNVASMEQLRATFRHPRSAFLESVARTGVGTVEAVAALVRLHAAQ